ncbi:conserved hypothetical protein [Vibrio chagasii]|nr:conserved hypothetical protein [Vibrio chagasii]
MLGAIIGDICGSHYEFLHEKSDKGFTKPLFVSGRSSFTDDTVLTIATAAKLLGKFDNYRDAYLATYERFKNMDSNGGGSVDIGYGKKFHFWAESKGESGYSSLGNGAAMRVSPVAYFASSRDEVLAQAKESAEVTHNSDEAVTSAQLVALAIYLAINGESAEEIALQIAERSKVLLGDSPESNPYLHNYCIHDLHREYRFSALASESVPHAIFIALQASSFEEAIRMGLYIGGDTDTICAIAGSIAEARFGIPDDMLKLLSPLKTFAPDYAEIANEFTNEFTLEVVPSKPVALTHSRLIRWRLVDITPFANSLVSFK